LTVVAQLGRSHRSTLVVEELAPLVGLLAVGWLLDRNRTIVVALLGLVGLLAAERSLGHNQTTLVVG
jgi:hypothetical protein